MKLQKTDYFKALMAGVAIGVANVTTFKIENIYVMAFLYSFYALVILKFDLKLFTSQVGFWVFHAGAYIEMIILNFLGSVIPVFIMTRDDSAKIMEHAMEGRYSQPPLVLFGLAFMCGIVIHVGYETKDRLLIIIAVMLITIGDLRHCVIDFPAILYIMKVEYFIKLLIVILGNVAGASLIHFVNIHSGITKSQINKQ